MKNWDLDNLMAKRKQEYVPSHEREGFDESKVIKVPIGVSSQTKDHWGHKKGQKKPSGHAWRKDKMS